AELEEFAAPAADVQDRSRGKEIEVGPLPLTNLLAAAPVAVLEAQVGVAGETAQIPRHDGARRERHAAAARGGHPQPGHRGPAPARVAGHRLDSLAQLTVLTELVRVGRREPLVHRERQLLGLSLETRDPIPELVADGQDERVEEAKEPGVELQLPGEQEDD